MNGLAARVGPVVPSTKVFLVRFGLRKELKDLKKSNICEPWKHQGLLWEQAGYSLSVLWR